MPRDLSAPLASLVAARRTRRHRALTITLADGTVLRYATARVTVGTTEYLPQLSGAGSLVIGLTGDDDSQDFKVENVSRAMGRALTSEVNMLDGAQGVSAMIFVDPETGAAHYDEQVPGELLAGEVTVRDVSFDLVDELFATTYPGTKVEEAFPFREPPAPETRPDPNDVVRPAPVGHNPDLEGDFPGRYRLPYDLFN